MFSILYKLIIGCWWVQFNVNIRVWPLPNIFVCVHFLAQISCNVFFLCPHLWGFTEIFPLSYCRRVHDYTTLWNFIFSCLCEILSFSAFLVYSRTGFFVPIYARSYTHFIPYSFFFRSIKLHVGRYQGNTLIRKEFLHTFLCKMLLLYIVKGSGFCTVCSYAGTVNL